MFLLKSAWGEDKVMLVIGEILTCNNEYKVVIHLDLHL